MKKYLKNWLWPTLLTTLILALFDALFVEKYFFQIKYIPLGNLRSSQKYLRLLLLSDLHLRHWLTKKHTRLAEKIQQLAPDLILMTGDAIDKHGKIQVLDHFLSLIDSKIPKAAILGNHEYKSGVDINQLKQIYEHYNGHLFINESKVYTLKNIQLTVTGIDDFIEGKDNLAQAVKDIGNQEHHFLLIHSPLQQEKVKTELDKINARRPDGEQLNISYIFAGHNHGGQVTLFGLFAPVLPKKSGNYLKGWYNQEKPYLYLSKGFGTSTLPFRFGARAEITLFYYYI
jgi:uncharacterized protein